MGDVRKKYRVCSTDFERENFFMAFNAGKKSYTVVSQGIIGFGKFFFYTNQITHTRPQRSNGRSLRT